jgi:transcription termination/antitermination protein NusG
MNGSRTGIARQVAVEPDRPWLEDDGEAPRWFAVWTHSQCEPMVEDALTRKRFDVFLPRVRVPSRRRDRHRMLWQPLFPGYVLVHVAPSRQALIDVANTHGVVRLIGERWDLPYPIPDEEVDSVRRVISSGERAIPIPWIHIGDRVRIVAGPLAGLEGLVQAWRAGRASFVVNLDLLQRSVGVEVAADIVERI